MIFWIIYIIILLIILMWAVVVDDNKTTKLHRIPIGLFYAILWPILLCILPIYLFFVEYEMHIKIKSYIINIYKNII